MVSSGPGHPTKYVVLFKRGSSCDEEEDDWDLQEYPDPDTMNLESVAAGKGGELDGCPLWAVLLCRTCREEWKHKGSWTGPCMLYSWRNPEYDGPIPPLHNPATQLVCSALTRTPEIKEQMRVEAEAQCGEQEELWLQPHPRYSEAAEPRKRKILLAVIGHGKLREFVKDSLFPPWDEGAEAGLK